MLVFSVTQKVMFGLLGDTDKPFQDIILVRVSTVAVAVSAIILTLGGIKLLTSPSLENSFLKKSPLYCSDWLCNV